MVDECEPAVEPAVGAASPEAAVGPADAAAEAPIASTDHMEAPEKKSDQSEPPPGRPRALSPHPGGGQFVIPFGAVCYPFCISAYQRRISYVSAVYQCCRTFAFLIRLYQIRIRNVFYMYQ